ncbi:hypothetical protein ROZALSC1DRAFT_26177, partial [Rozella allomycis CSF55]
MREINDAVAGALGVCPADFHRIKDVTGPLMTSLENASRDVKQKFMTIVNNVVSLLLESYKALIENWQISLSALTSVVVPIVAYYNSLEAKSTVQDEPLQVSEKEKKLKPKTVSKP